MTIHLIRDLESLHRRLLSMCAKVEEIVNDAIRIYTDHTPLSFDKVLKRDHEIDAMDISIEEECLKLLALHQPVATDLRRITTVMKISAELERVADLALNLTERLNEMKRAPKLVVPSRFTEMVRKSIGMLRRSIDSYVNLDAVYARSVCEDDEIVDELNREIIEELIVQMKKFPETIESGIHLISASKHIERVADHASNIAEDVIYLVEGNIVRHRHQHDAGETP